ncbi:uncharacterized protein LOC143059375 isoform X1 [Mytilus galloprovincialis]|uniref:uncharacterized protein LOC143059375 isoform X1 n=2 Tax=Mytilus galloprovincialis TaxID=29158 RepID=UPI003F7CA9C3
MICTENYTEIMALKMSAAAMAMMLVISVHICHGKTQVTYAFPTDACASDPYLVDENTMVYMKFEGDFGSQECRQMSFTTPKSPFYSYTMCMKELFYSSPKCQSKVNFKKYWSDYYSYDYNNEQILGEDCSGNSYSRMFSRCLTDASHVSFKLKKSKRENNGYNRYDNKKQQELIPDKLNDTFSFQIETKWEYNYGLVGGIAGGIVGMCVLTAVGIYLCINCRRRKRLTGRYCCACPTYRPNYSKFMKEGLSQGFSAECAVAGILLCSCVLCRRQTRNGHESEQCEKVTMGIDYTSSDAENKWETVKGLQDPDTVPLIQCDN